LDESLDEGTTPEMIILTFMILENLLSSFFCFTWVLAIVMSIFLVEEDGHALGVEEDKCKMITEKTVFDHIRQKAKSFSLLSAFDNIRCPSLEVFLSKDNTRVKSHNHHHEIVVLDDEDGLQVPQPNGVNLPVELKKAEQDGIKHHLTLNDHDTTGSSNIVDTGTARTCHVMQQVVFSLSISCYHCFFLSLKVFSSLNLKQELMENQLKKLYLTIYGENPRSLH